MCNLKKKILASPTLIDGDESLGNNKVLYFLSFSHPHTQNMQAGTQVESTSFLSSSYAKM